MEKIKKETVNDSELTVMALQFTPIAIAIILLISVIISFTIDTINGELPFVSGENVEIIQSSGNNNLSNTYQWN